MSNVNAAGKRDPNYIRAALKIGLGCVLLGGCSAGSERFTSASFGSGYDAAPAPQASASRVAVNPQYANAQYGQGQQPASYQQQTASYSQQPRGGYQLASATPTQSGGYMQVSRVDLPPLQQQQAPASSGTKTADGYGPYNQPPLSDGTYSGPRVYTPYDQPSNNYAPPPPPPPANDGPRYDRDAPPPPPPSFYRHSDNDAPPPAYGSSNEARVYEPKPEPDYRDEPGYRSDYGRDERGDGKYVRVEPGDTLYSLAIRHGVTVDMIRRANRLGARYYVRPGTRLFIPSAGPAKYGQAEGPVKAEPAACTGDQCHVVRQGETIASIARSYRLTERQILEANNLPNPRALKAGQTLVIPGREAPDNAIASAAPQSRGPQKEAAIPPAAAMAPADKGGVTSQAAEPMKPAPEVKMASAKPAEPSCEAALANPIPRMGKTFRKPVEGLIIGQFGPQRDGTVNEGVTISVPKGTPIKAAENGVVAYVGDELPGFGNLILIRHADEYVTAYAHADEILVKKCDVVKRGQVVAKAGATGDASQPQLHFEIRKNAKPVDPAPLLGS